jgi:hypothetical protein
MKRWYLSSKYCDLGPVGFPKDLRSVTATAVPFYGLFAVLPPARLDYHLVHTAILDKLKFLNSLGVFLNRIFSSSSLFCGIEFQMAESYLTLQ